MKKKPKKRVVFNFSQEEIDYIHGKLDVQALLTKAKNQESELSALREDKKVLTSFLRHIKHYCLTTKEPQVTLLLGQIVRLCINAGVKESYSEIEQLERQAIDAARKDK